MIPQFTTSQYATKEALLEAKCKWLEEQMEWLECNEVDVTVEGGYILLAAYSCKRGWETFTGESLLDCIQQAREQEFCKEMQKLATAFEITTIVNGRAYK